MSTETVTIPRCPRCNSMNIRQELRPCIGMESEGDTTYMVNGSIKRCWTCGHAWDRTASRGVGLKNYPQIQPKHPERALSFWTRLFQRLFPFIN